MIILEQSLKIIYFEPVNLIRKVVFWFLGVHECASCHVVVTEPHTLETELCLHCFRERLIGAGK